MEHRVNDPQVNWVMGVNNLVCLDRRVNDLQVHLGHGANDLQSDWVGSSDQWVRLGRVSELGDKYGHKVRKLRVRLCWVKPVDGVPTVCCLR